MFLFKKNNYYLFIVLTGFLFSVFFSIYCISKFDKDSSSNNRAVINGIVGNKDTFTYWNEAKQHVENFRNNNLIKSEKPEYFSSWLHSKVLAVYLVISSSDLFLNNKEKKTSEINKLNFFIFQSIFFYLSLIFLFKNIKKKYGYKSALFVIIFLSFEPNILQYHSSLLSESIFFSLNVIIFSILINLNFNKLKNLFLGLLVGVACLQRGIAFYYFIPIILYYFLIFKKKSVKPILIFLIGFLFIQTLLGLSNYLRTNNFFTKPMVSYVIFPRYFVVNLLYPEVFKTNQEQSYKLFYNNNLNLEKVKSEINKRNILENFHKKGLNEIYKYPLESLIVFVKNFPKTLAFDPLEIFLSYKFNVLDDNFNFYEEYKIFRIVYSLILYLIILIGFFNFFKYRNNLAICVFVFFISCYFSIIATIDGATERILIPSLIYLSVFFSSGVNALLYKNKNQLKQK
jgi:hypothetical protein